ncbi:MAG: LysR substrate-binding domain-containing protein, partial [Pseudomonadales bacterium]
MAGRHLSFKDAADELAVTASAVSHQIKNLESFLGVTLFERKTRSLELTDAGRRYFEFLDGMFARLESETQQLRTQFGRDIIRLWLPPFFANEALLKTLSSFPNASTETDIRVSTQRSGMNTHPAEADLSVLLGHDDWSELTTYRLFARRLVTACAPSLLKKQKFESYDSLNGHTLIVQDSGRDSWEQWAATLDIPAPKPKKLIRFDSMSAVVRAAEQGLGIALVSWPLAKDRFTSGALVRVFETELETGDNFYLAHRPED